MFYGFCMADIQEGNKNWTPKCNIFFVVEIFYRVHTLQKVCVCVFVRKQGL